MPRRPIDRRGEPAAVPFATAPPVAPVRELIRDLREGRALLAVAGERLGFLPLMAVLAVLASVFEGAGITLLIPLVQSLGRVAGPGAAFGHLRPLESFIGGVPAGVRTQVILGLMFLALAAKNIFSYANLALLVVVYGRLSHRLRTRVFGQVLALPLAKAQQERSGKLLNTLDTETWRATDALNLTYLVVTSLATTAVFIALLVLLSWQLALVATCVFLLIPLLVQLVGRRAKRVSRAAHQANEALAQQTWSTINGLRTIHTFGREDFEQARFARLSDRVRGLFLKHGLVSAATGPLAEMLVFAALAALVLLVRGGAVGLSTLVAFIALLYRLQPRLIALVSAQFDLAGLNASIAAVGDLLKAPVSGQLRPAGPGGQEFGGCVSFRQVAFAYPQSDAPVLQDVSFDLPACGLIAIVGPSGAGKSTLLDLLLGFQAPLAGEIRIGRSVLTEAAAAAWRRHVGVVSQDPYVFDDSVRANILYGRPEASDAEVRAAARAAAADGFIEALPDGYETRVGERAAHLSGGQRQRIALARALLRDPALLVLDEATNALDAGSEAHCLTTLKRIALSRPVVIVAHKRSTISHADHVIVLEAGAVIEQGPPETLIASGGTFARMFAPDAANPRPGVLTGARVA